MINLDANNARERFSRGPMGTWETSLGGGHDNLMGIRLTFDADGTGSIVEWGLYYDHPNPADEPTFQWKSADDRRIEITHLGKTTPVRFDFKTKENEYKLKELRMFEPGRKLGAYGDVGFWLSPFSLVWREELSRIKRIRRLFFR